MDAVARYPENNRLSTVSDIVNQQRMRLGRSGSDVTEVHHKNVLRRMLVTPRRVIDFHHKNLYDESHGILEDT